jgi:HSP20 family protein
MLTPLLSHRDSFSELRGLLQQMDEIFRDVDRPLLGSGADAWMPVEVTDEGDALAVRMDVPGVGEDELFIEATQQSVTIRGERGLAAPAGYRPHWRERQAKSFTRTFALSSRIDVENVTATLKHGVLSMRLAKLPEERPKQVTVKAARTEKEEKS